LLLNQMSKKYIYILIGIIILALVTLLGLFFMKSDDPTSEGFFSFPFGNAPDGEGINIPSNPSNTINPPVSNTNTGSGVVRQISNSPISGATIITQASTTFVRYIDRGTGHVFDYTPETGISKRVSNTTIPKAQEVVWSKDGSSFIMRIVSDSIVKDFSARLSSASTSTPEGELGLVGSYLVGQKVSIVSSPDGKKIFYTSPTSSNGALGTVSGFDGGAPATIWQFPTKEWRIHWPISESLFLTTKASSEEKGYAYILNSKTGDMTGVLSGVTGLIANPHPTLKHVLYSEQNKGRTYLFLLELATGRISPVGPPTLAEKCAWDKNEKLTAYCGASASLPNNLPDNWYKGTVSFNDEIWKMNFETGETKLLASKDSFGGEIDVENIMVSEDGKLLIFQNKKNLSLWSVVLSAQ